MPMGTMQEGLGNIEESKSRECRRTSSRAASVAQRNLRVHPQVSLRYTCGSCCFAILYANRLPFRTNLAALLKVSISSLFQQEKTTSFSTSFPINKTTSVAKCRHKHQPHLPYFPAQK